MSDADYEVTSLLLLEKIDILLCEIVEFFPLDEVHALDQSWVDLGQGLRSGKSEESDLGSELCCVDCISREKRISGVVEDITADDRELGILHQIDEMLVTEVELVVSESGEVVSGCIHECNG